MSEEIRQQYEVLSELRKVEDKVARLRRGLSRIPEELAKLEANLAEKKGDFDRAKTGFVEFEKKLRQAELDLKEREAQLQKAESKMMDVKTNEEYQAALKENETRKQEIAKIEEQILVLMGQVDEHRKRLGEDEATFHRYAKAFEEDRKRLEAERAHLEERLAETEALRKEDASRLGDSTARVYEKIKQGGILPAITLIDNATCRGCHMRVPPQMYNEILGHKAVYQCPTCSRLLVLPGSGPDSGEDEQAL